MRFRWIFAALLSATVASGSAQQSAAVRGVVRNSSGVPQMGVVVELLGTHAQVVANGFTDLNGRFVLHDLAPGSYQLRATAALYLPVLRSKLQLRAGDLSIVNVMLSGLFEQAWPDRTKARGDVPDDWRWTLRSSANRPLLRVLDEDAAATAMPTESHQPRKVTRAAVVRGQGGFGETGTLSSIQQERVTADETSTSFLRFVTMQGPKGVVGMDLVTGVERHAPFSPVRKAAARVQIRPELGIAGQKAGLLVADAAAGERVSLGDFAEVESGGLLRTVQLGHKAGAASYPFLHVRAPFGDGWELSYALASDPECQGVDDVGLWGAESPKLAVVGGSLRPEQSLHQAVAVRRRVGKASLAAMLEHDTRTSVVLTGVSGGVYVPGSHARPSDEVRFGSPGSEEIVDPASGNFVAAHNGYTSQGWSVAVSYPSGETSIVAVQFTDGVALGAERGSSPHAAAPHLTSVRVPSAKVSLQSTLARSGTRLRAVYAWQPAEVVSVVSPFSQGRDGAFLSIHLKQPLRVGSILPQGTVLTIDGENLLREGYVALASADAESAYLAGTLRSLQAGVSFSF